MVDSTNEPRGLSDRRLSIFVKEGTMGWIRRFHAMNGARYGAQNGIRSSAIVPIGLGETPTARIAEKIKLRQVSLAVRYVWMVRTR